MTEIATVNNGSRLQATLPNYTGEVGMALVRGVYTISYVPATRDRVPIGSTVIIGGDEWRVAKYEASKFVSGMVLLEVEHIK